MLVVPLMWSATELVAITSQVFGGCCSNVFVLEKLLDTSGDLGSSVTFFQFVFISAMAYFQVAERTQGWQRLYLRPNIPLHRWFVSVLMFFGVSLLNNWVWRFNISIPLHIILRSSGTVITMFVGYVFGGKRYLTRQIVACLLISTGTIAATLRSTSSLGQVLGWGVVALLAASFLSAFLGLYTESLFRQYGNHWKEGLFYTHALALPLFLVVSQNLRQEWNTLSASPPWHGVPLLLLLLALNVVSQYVCIRGVNMLAGRASSLTVTVVLLIRKFVSLILSVLWFGSALTLGQVVGAVLVFLGGLLYAWPGKQPTMPAKQPRPAKTARASKSTKKPKSTRKRD